MATSNLENQLHSAQKNLLFLQQEHANTLKGLHAEIRRLQQHCTDLTYELTVKSADQTENGFSRSDELRRKCEELEAQLKVKETENNELLKELEQKNAMIMVLENTIKEREKKYLEELKVKSHKLNMLSSELEQRASTIAYLTSQLHATKKKLMSASGTSDVVPPGSPVLGSYKPSPPKEKLPETPRRRMKKSLSTPLNADFAEVYRLGADGRKILLREPVDAMPDPTPFLLARQSADTQIIKERPLVIPPIRSDSSSPAKEKKHKAHIGVAHRIPHATPVQNPLVPQPEVETLAVDQVNGSKIIRKHSGTDRTI
ncbi:coiled-coil domain-containing protein 92 [Bombina bombina]|uniref:coiled-coil domain-containing protein 92 n=1 Tax=Bombina bombina TaxID=8345 RepID=UPI00235AC00C|nr:coiled-coil domain-containing protein 92 [Bombina bombina]XP_053557796.1 coiled-coil domain-containing protein 92 [Bombina bombina]XP_053557797.1 coiled-coil domain-containing protein 92 [Bombina bombina]XP_053557798.1 coiled-coil domain-containing protein 92 [Bombina bombina]XP_053557799.1 coiled-coil domain-containing protein 92 [Bombina bombina]